MRTGKDSRDALTTVDDGLAKLTVLAERGVITDGEFLVQECLHDKDTSRV